MASITTGTVSSLFILTPDTFYNFAGDGFSASGVLVSFGIDEVFTTGIVHLGMGGSNSTATIGDLTCDGRFPASAPADCHYPQDPLGNFHADNGSLDLHSTPLPFPPPSVISATFIEPFTATGSLVIGDGLDLTGQGILEVTWCPTCSTFLNVHYTFTVDEPSSWGLMLAAIAALLIGRFWRAFGQR
jgi:hypothetical protein